MAPVVSKRILARLRKATWRGQRIDWSGYLFVLPFSVFFTLFTAGAIAFGIYLSFTDWGIVGEINWVGLSNFRKALTDELVVRAFLNTFRYASAVVPGVTILAFLFALFVHQRWPGHTFARVAFFAPYVCAASVIGLIWVWLLDTQFGLINLYLGKLGIPSIPWLTSTRWSWVGVSVTSIWWDLGFSFVLFLAALQEVPLELVEAALIDGASRFQSFRHVILPLLRPVISMVVILQTISTLRIFSQVVVMTAGGPAASSTSVIHYLYAYGLRRGHFGYAAAIAMMLFAVTLAITLIYRRLMKEAVE